ncbi:MAG: hypothetical protein ROR55_02475 [Devosia sp.]
MNAVPSASILPTPLLGSEGGEIPVCENGPEQPLVQLKQQLEKNGVEALWLEGKGGPGTYSAKTQDIDVGEIFRAFDEVTAHLTEWEMDMRARGVAEY